MNNYDDYTDYNFTNDNGVAILPDFTSNPIPTDINDFIDEEVKVMPDWKIRLIFYPVGLLTAIVLGVSLGYLAIFADMYIL